MCFCGDSDPSGNHTTKFYYSACFCLARARPVYSSLTVPSKFTSTQLNWQQSYLLSIYYVQALG